jgi:hypothetical protein
MVRVALVIVASAEVAKQFRDRNGAESQKLRFCEASLKWNLILPELPEPAIPPQRTTAESAERESV